MQAVTPLDFCKLTIVELAFLHLQCSPADVRKIFDVPSAYYVPITVPRRKRSQKLRTVYAVRPPLRTIHRTIAVALAPELAKLPACVQGFRRGGSVLNHAKQHCGKDFVLTVDLEDFFGNIHIEQVADVFESLGCKRQPAILLARLCTYNGTLPQGGRASPGLSNLCTKRLDDAMLKHCGENISYSRYADDLAFSGDSVPTQSELEGIIQPLGFTLRSGSFRLQPRNSGQIVTGVSVSDSVPRIPRTARREIETALHFGEIKGLDQHFEHIKKSLPPSLRAIDLYVRRLYGRINSYAPVEPELCNQFRSRLDKLTE